MDFSGDFEFADFASVSKAVGRPPASKTGGRDWGSDDKGNLPPGTGDNDDDSAGGGGGGGEEKTSTGTIAGIVAGLVLVFIGVAIFAVRYTKRKSNDETLPHAAAHQVVTSVDNPAFDQGVEEGGLYMAPSGDHTKLYDAAKARRRQLAEESEIYDPIYTNSPLSGLEATPVVSLDHAVATAAVHCGGGPYDERLDDARCCYEERFPAGATTGADATVLSREDAATLHVYSQESNVYKGLNGALGGYGVGGRAAIPHYFELIKLLLIACRNLLIVPPATVYRGVQIDVDILLGGAGVGETVTWWGFTSTTHDADVLRQDSFFGFGKKNADGTLRKRTPRTVFQIRVNAGVNIQPYSAIQEEDEVLLLPGATFVVKEINRGLAFNVTEVKLQQVESVNFATGDMVPSDLIYSAIEDDVYEFESFDVYSGLASTGNDDGDYQIADPLPQVTYSSGFSSVNNSSNGGDIYGENAAAANPQQQPFYDEATSSEQTTYDLASEA